MRTFRILAITLLVATLVSCDFDQKPYSEISDSNFFTNQSEVDAGMLGCYNILQTVMNNEWAMTEMRSDNTRPYGRNSSTGVSVELAQMDRNLFLTTNTYLNNYWEACYAGIYRCNNVLQFLDVVEDQQMKAWFEGEARTLRAMLYFNLVRLWGPVFLMDKVVTPTQARYTERTPEDGVYTFIIDELNAVIEGNLLPAKQSQSAAWTGRATIEMAKVLLAKAYITHFRSGTQEYIQAGSLLKEVITACGNPQSKSDLETYARIFDVSNEMNKEIIFAVRYKSGNLGLGSPHGNNFAPILSGADVVIGQGRSYNYVTTNIIDFFKTESGDLRIDVSYAEGYYKNGTTWVSEALSAGQARFIKKYLDPAQATRDDGEPDWPVIRMGDVLLLYAEVCNEMQDATSALKYLNMIRDRAGLAAVQTTGVFELRQAIHNERRRELAFENHRFYDLLRWGNAVEVLNTYVAAEGFYGAGAAYNYTPIEEWNLLLPIPQSIMNINPSIPQNPGY